MEISELEAYYTREILPNYGIDGSGISWLSHGSVATDIFAHYFTYDSNTYILVFEDFPSTQHYIAEDNELLSTIDGRLSVETKSEEYVENVTGVFTLFKESQK